MPNEQSHKRCPQCNADLTSGDTRHVSKNRELLTPAQTQLLDFINALDAPDLVQSLKLVHDLALYHSDGPIEDPEKVALYWMKGLWEHIQAISMES
nr:hypothetical protein [Allomuricauda sp.]